jgi:hypothetical protein
MRVIFSIIVFLLSFQFNSAQMNEVSGGNIGLSANGGLILNSPSGAGFGFEAGVTTSFGGMIFPELNYSKRTESYGVDSLNTELSSSSSFLGLGVNNKIPIWSLKLGKSTKGECWWLNFKLLLDYNYRWMLNNTSNFNFTKGNESGLNLGLGLRPAYSGGHKSRVAWSYYYDVYYRLDLNKSKHPEISSESWKQNGLFFRVTVVHHKTSDFLDSGINKRKAYGRKY